MFRDEANSVFNNKTFSRLVVLGAMALTSTTGSSALAWQDSKAAPVFRDIRLGGKGQLSLSVVAMTGKQLGGQSVSVLHNGKVVCRTQSSRDGKVSITGLRPGPHTIQVGKNTVLCRLWAASSAPPNAIARPAFVADDVAIRGQYGPPMLGAPMMPMVAPAVLATGVTATALAVVLIGKSSGNDNDAFLPASP